MKTRLSLSRIGFARGVIGAGAALGLGAPAMADFDFPDFSVPTGLTTAGNATISANTVTVTPAAAWQAGGVWFTGAKQLVTGTWDCVFDIRVFNKAGIGADGFAFVIQNSGTAAPIGGPAGAIGYADNLTFGQPGIANSLAVELDMWNNASEWNDFGQANSVSIQSRGMLTNQPDAAASLAHAATPDLSDGFVHRIRVNYSSNVMSVYVDGVKLITQNVDLTTLLSLDAGTAWLGITAGTGLNKDREGHELVSWSFSHPNPNDAPAPGSAALLGMGGLAVARRRRK